MSQVLFRILRPIFARFSANRDNIPERLRQLDEKMSIAATGRLAFGKMPEREARAMLKRAQESANLAAVGVTKGVVTDESAREYMELYESLKVLVQAQFG